MPDSPPTSEPGVAKEGTSICENLFDAECTIAEMLYHGEESLSPPVKRKRGRPAKVHTVEGRLARSRQSAKECRVRKKMRYENLHHEVNRMEQENLEMRRQLQQILGYLEEQALPVTASLIESWRAELLEHDRLHPDHHHDYQLPDEAQPTGSWSSSSSSSASSSSSGVVDGAHDEVT